MEVIAALAGGDKRSLVFTRTKHGAERLARQLTTAGIPAAELHGNLRQGARSRNLAAFGSGAVRVMVATDIAARGIHVDGIDLVIHADPPAEHKAYVHRSGRTARGGADGVVVTMQTAAQAREVRDLMRKAGVTPQVAEADPDSAVVREIAGPPAQRVTLLHRAADLVQPGGPAVRAARRAAARHRPTRQGQATAAPIPCRRRWAAVTCAARAGGPAARQSGGEPRYGQRVRAEQGFDDRGERAVRRFDDRGERPARRFDDRGERTAQRSMTGSARAVGRSRAVIGRLRGLRLAVPANGRGAATERAPSRGRGGAEQGFVPGIRGGGARAATGGTRGRDGIPDQRLGSHDTFPARGRRSLPPDGVD